MPLMLAPKAAASSGSVAGIGEPALEVIID